MNQTLSLILCIEKLQFLLSQFLNIVDMALDNVCYVDSFQVKVILMMTLSNCLKSIAKFNVQVHLIS